MWQQSWSWSSQYSSRGFVWCWSQCTEASTLLDAAAHWETSFRPRTVCFLNALLWYDTHLSQKHSSQSLQKYFASVFNPSSLQDEHSKSYRASDPLYKDMLFSAIVLFNLVVTNWVSWAHIKYSTLLNLDIINGRDVDITQYNVVIKQR